MRRGIAALVLVACGLPEPVLDGEHVRLAMDPGLVACGDPVGHMDDFVAMIADEFDVPAPTGDDRIDFYWLHPTEFAARTVCIKDGGACSVLGSVYSIALPFDHELVHAVARAFGTPPPFFIEGLAVAYELPYPGQYQDSEPLWNTDVMEAVTTRVGAYLPPSVYALAGAFTSFIIERHGITKFMRVYRKLRFLDGAPRISRVFSEVFGESLEDAAAAFEQAVGVFDASGPDVPCPAKAFRLKRFECAAPTIAWDGVHLAEYRTLDCDQDDVLGPFAGDELVLYRTLEVPADGVYEFGLIADATVGSGGRWNWLEVARCGGCEDYAAFTMPAGTVQQRLPGGRYSLRIVGPAREASGVGLRVDRVALAEPGPP